MDTFLDVTGIVKRAKQVLNFKNDSELAEYLGVSRATVSNWGRGTVLISVCCSTSLGTR